MTAQSSSRIDWQGYTDGHGRLPAGLALHSGDGQAVVTLHGRIVGWNDAAERMLRVPTERAMGSLLADIAQTRETWETIWGLHITTVGAHLGGNPPTRRTLRTRDGDNRQIIVNSTSSLLRFEGHQPLVVYSFIVQALPGTTEAQQPPLGLTAREWEVACLLMSGLGTKEIAVQLSLKYATVRAHIRNILVTLDVHTRVQALMKLWSRFGTPELKAPFPDIHRRG